MEMFHEKGLHVLSYPSEPPIIAFSKPRELPFFWLSHRTLRKCQCTGVSYTGCIFLGLGNLITAIPVVSLGRSVFYRERSVSMYSVLPYAMAAGFIEIPYIIVQVEVPPTRGPLLLVLMVS